MIKDEEGFLSDHTVEAHKMAIKALEQEPTTKNDLGVDAISRANVRSLICKIDRKYMFGLSGKAFQDLYKGIDDMPSVTPQEPKTGHWIDSSNGWMCSECNKDNTFDTNYCPNCGAKMESEE